MSVPAYKNISAENRVLPAYNSSVIVSPEQYVVGTFYTDLLENDNDFEEVADYATLTWVQSLKIKYFYPEGVESETPVLPAAPGVVADGNGTTDTVAYWSDANTLGELVGITVDEGEVDVVTANSFVGPVTALASATTSVDVSGATAPEVGQVLTATSGTAATWQTPSGGGNFNIVSLTTAQHTVTTETAGTLFFDNTIGGCEVVLPTPVAGLHYQLLANTGNNISFSVDDGQTQTINGDNAAGISVSTTDQSAYIQVVATSTTNWEVLSSRGTWTINGPG